MQEHSLHDHFVCCCVSAELIARVVEDGGKICGGIDYS